jgi:hypothetical protein
LAHLVLSQQVGRGDPPRAPRPVRAGCSLPVLSVAYTPRGARGQRREQGTRGCRRASSPGDGCYRPDRRVSLSAQVGGSGPGYHLRKTSGRLGTRQICWSQGHSPAIGRIPVCSSHWVSGPYAAHPAQQDVRVSVHGYLGGGMATLFGDLLHPPNADTPMWRSNPFAFPTV